ncbi:MAG TPA: PD-(D/E)XK nuclease family protein [Thermoanaerobaculaceae bacterium]|nr:PD-(D/E)XK nuclease family protein [Thermoanaerobaculaceae bacterium]
MTGGEGGTAPRIRVGRGARATEALVLADLDSLLDAAREDPSLLARPVVVVVPSRSLRLHLAERLVARRGRAAAGVEVRTLHGLAARIVERFGQAPRPAARLVPLLVRRFTSREPALAPLVLQFDDGELPVHATVRDLLDAGFAPEHAGAAVELLTERGAGAEEARALALVRVAVAVSEELARLGLATGGEVLSAAAELLQRDAERVLPARAVLVHGFADATGVATDLIAALLRHRGATAYLDRPPDPADQSTADIGAAFGERFGARLGGIASRESETGAPSAPARLALVQAPGAQAEVREIARRVRALAEAGTPFERIGVVARDLGGYVQPLQLHFTRLAIPFSTLDAPGSRDAEARRAGALAALLALGEDAPADLWLGALGDEGGFDLRLGLRACAAARLRDVAALEPAALLGRDGDLALPVRRGLAVREDDGGEGTPVAPRRALPGRQLRRAVRRARALVARLRGWPAEAPLAEHVRTLRRLVASDLLWRASTPASAAAWRELAALEAALPARLVLERDEFLALARRGFAGVGGARRGGAGGGVQVLSVTEARARTFAHLFVLGLNRDAFPRQVREDPLLPDRLRGALATVLPDIPIKRSGFDEERYLFAQLLSAADAVTLSWQSCDDDGKPRLVSPLVERLRVAAGLGEAPSAPPAVDPASSDALRPGHEVAVLAGLAGSRREFGAALELACREQGAAAADELAAARLAVLEELDPDRRSAEGRERAARLGPYFGFVGAVRSAADPRRAPLAVTTAEDLARCPWQTFLRRVLRLEASPDPLADAPGVDAQLVGLAVHAVLERIVREASGRRPATLAEALAAGPAAVAWPDAAALGHVTREACGEVLREAGLALPGLDGVLRELAAPYLDAARVAGWPATGAIDALGVEVTGEARVAHRGGERGLRFRADRAERLDGRLVLTDYKTGKPVADGKQQETRRRQLEAAVRGGRALQAVAYALGTGTETGRGRYLYLRPDLAEELRVLAADGDDAPLREAFAGAIAAILDAWDLGALFPRLEVPGGGEEPPTCRWCEVREACVRGDSAARRRLARWAADGGGTPTPAEAALAALWRLGAKREREPEAG